MDSEKPAPSVSLGDFIERNMEPILQRWEDFAREIWPGEPAEVVTLRNDAASMLKAVVEDMARHQTKFQQREKSEGRLEGAPETLINASALSHARSRMESGFGMVKLVAEFRALRASVNHFWASGDSLKSGPAVDDMLRFNEAIDQLVAASVAEFSENVERNRQLFLGMLSHDLRQPLQSMQMLIALLEERGSSRIGIEAIRENMKLACSSMAALLSDLLDFSSGQLGSGISLKVAPMDLRVLSNEVISELRYAHPERELFASNQGDLTGVWDSAQLRRLISNLLSNAIDHGSEEPIHLTIRDLSTAVEIEVRNQGVPIPSSAIATLFDPLVRVHRDDKVRRHGSMGLGLYICREIARAHKGDIHVKSAAEVGTSFVVQLPRENVPARERE